MYDEMEEKRKSETESVKNVAKKGANWTLRGILLLGVILCSILLFPIGLISILLIPALLGYEKRKNPV